MSFRISLKLINNSSPFRNMIGLSFLTSLFLFSFDVVGFMELLRIDFFTFDDLRHLEDNVFFLAGGTA